MSKTQCHTPTSHTILYECTIPHLTAHTTSPTTVLHICPRSTSHPTPHPAPLHTPRSSLHTFHPALTPPPTAVNFRPQWAARVARLVKPFTGVIGVFYVGMGIYVYWDAMTSLDGSSIWATILLPFLGYIIGTVVAKVGVCVCVCVCVPVSKSVCACLYLRARVCVYECACVSASGESVCG